MSFPLNSLEDAAGDFPVHIQAPSPSSRRNSTIIMDNTARSSSAASRHSIDGCPMGEFKSTVIIRGGFGAVKEENFPCGCTALRCYPPPPNAAYELTSEAHNPKHIKSFRDAVDPVNVATNNIEKQTKGGDLTYIEVASAQVDLDGSTNDRHEVDVTTVIKRNSVDHVELIGLPIATTCCGSKGEILANTINFERATWVMTTPGVSGILYAAEEQRGDFIKTINSGAELDYCSKCKMKHIPPGSPITLQDRDTCGAYLPEWFPTDQMEKPWDTFTALMNEIVTLNEILQGYGHKSNPERPEWDLKYHERHIKWRSAGRRGGWWKCRDTADAPEVERACNLCHKEKTEEEKAAEMVKFKSVAERVQALQAYIDQRMKEIGDRDKAIVLARIGAKGWPEHLGAELVIEEEELPKVT